MSEPEAEPEPEPEPEPEQSKEEAELWQQQMVKNAAAGNIDISELATGGSLPTLLKLCRIPQLRTQACRVLCTVAATQDVAEAALIEAQAQPLADTVAGLLSGNTVQVAAEIIAAFVRHEAVRAALFRNGAVASLQQMLSGAVVQVESDCEGPLNVAQVVARDLLEELVSAAAGTAPEPLPPSALSAVHRAASAVVHEEEAPARKAAEAGWYAAHPCGAHSGHRGRLRVADTEAEHVMCALDNALTRVVGGEVRRRHSASAAAARALRRRERGWGAKGGRGMAWSQLPALRRSTQRSDGAAEREQNLRRERRSRAALAEWKEAEAAKEETLRAARERADQRKAVALWGGDEQMGARAHTAAQGGVFGRVASGPVARGEAALRAAIPLPDCHPPQASKGLLAF